ncbi:MAG: carboxypeptidase M32 [Candidatus Aphodomonas sp.]|nr:carboxypeptidase M32 [Candidatus Aphodomonas sp.]
MELAQAITKLDALQRKMFAYNHAMGVLYYDGATAAPAGSAANRGETMAVLSEAEYLMATGPEMIDLLDFLYAHNDELTQKQRRIVEMLRKDLAELRCIPQEEYAAASKLMAESTAAWHEAKPRSDFSIFAPYLEKVIETKKRFAHYVKPDIDPYEYYLDTYEPGLTRRKCDEFFAALRARVVPLLRRVQAARQVDASFLTGDFPLEAQRKLSDELMEIMRIDRSFCSIGETEHPFTTNFTKRDVRITTHYYPDNAVSSMYSVIHEGGHALYELHTADEDMYNGLGSGVSMGLHESQSRFYENLVGRSRGFVTFLAPRLRALFPQQLGGVSDDALYRAVNRCKASLVRTEADELTYSLHIMVRYEIEKKLFADEISVAEIPQEWNRLYQEYLGVTPSCDRDGCLQDSHWSDGSFGYFPSYALGSAYGAQMLARMRETVDVDACEKNGDLAPINAWLCEHIWQYGCLYKPAELLERVFETPFDPKYYLDYLETKFTEIYGL